MKAIGIAAVAIIGVTIMLPNQATGQNASSVQASPSAAKGSKKLDCMSGPAKELDFWIGKWKVTRHSNGADYGVNRFTKLIDGCAIHEDFEAKSSNGGFYRGTSLSFFDPADRQWHQFYVDNNGRRSVYAGNMKDGDWVMIAPGMAPGRGPYLQRMIVRLNPDGSVRQLGAISIDQGKTWRPIFDLDYRRM